MTTILNAAVLALGGILGASAVALWAALQPQTVENISTMDPSSAIVTLFSPPGYAWLVGIAIGVFVAYIVLRYFRKI